MIRELCKGKNVVRRGRQKTNSKLKQIYYCKDCKKRFVFSSLKGKSFDARVILNAISYYNLGNTLEQSSKLVNKKFRVKTSKSIIHKWLNEFKDIFSYHRLRNKVLRKYGKDVIASKLFKHRGLTYNYKYHKAKLDLFGKRHYALLKYLKSFEKSFPHKFFEKDERCSQIKVDIKTLKKDKNNYACKLAKLALSAVSDNHKRHDLVENFMLVNDTATIGVEVPVWFWEKKLVNAETGKKGLGICGHIDILQLRYGNIHVLDYKPNAVKENSQNVASQLYLYALGLSFRTRIKLEKFRCAWFDDKVYYEFAPDKVKVKW